MSNKDLTNISSSVKARLLNIAQATKGDFNALLINMDSRKRVDRERTKSAIEGLIS